MIPYAAAPDKAPERIYNALAANPTHHAMNNRELSLLADMSPRNVTRMLKLLLTQKKIKIVRPSRIRRLIYVL